MSLDLRERTCTQPQQTRRFQRLVSPLLGVGGTRALKMLLDRLQTEPKNLVAPDHFDFDA